PLRLQPLVECHRDVLRECVVEPVNGGFPLAQVDLVELQQDRLPDDKVFAGADRDNTVRARVDGELHANGAALTDPAAFGRTLSPAATSTTSTAHLRLRWYGEQRSQHIG